MWFKKLLCLFLGHNFICLYKQLFPQGGSSTERTGWKCTRCEKTLLEQWDDTW